MKSTGLDGPFMNCGGPVWNQVYVRCSIEVYIGGVNTVGYVVSERELWTLEREIA